MGRVQSGYVYEASGALYVRYWTSEIVDGKPQRVQRSERLCDVDDKCYISRPTDRKTGKKRTVLSSALKLKLNDKMQTVNVQEVHRRPGQDMTVADFWETKYLPYCEEIVELTGEPRKKPSTVRGYKQIWKQHLKAHFGETSLQDYEPWMGSDFLQSLTAKQGKATLKHIKALGGSLFKRAVIERRIKVNPWHDVEMPEDAVESEATPHYTLEEAEDIVSALVDHVDCQLVLALACFLGLRPGEIAALKWEDFDTENDLVHIRRSVVRGIVGTPKTPESLAALPLPAQVRIPLELWRQAVEREEAERKADAARNEGIEEQRSGYVFETRNGTPIDLHNLTARVIRPHIEGSHYKLHGKAQECVRCNKVPKSSGRRWKTLYAGRRCAATAVIEANNGNLAIGQALLRHKSQITTAMFYKKAVTPETLRNGVKMLEAAANGKIK
ncbi:MAG TPA: site-specific integrase [Candidatus Aquilonibacter sp.]|jgi:integrase|nr:site-specific integrase [Candidatus Aquilonibacter sp.]